MKFITPRLNSDGSIRLYFIRRGVTVLRLFGEPGEESFARQYEFATAIRRKRGWTSPEARNLQSEIRKLSDEGRKELCASRLARSVNSRARHQYKVESEITPQWILTQIEKQGGKCAVSGMPFNYERGFASKDRRNPNAPSVDRLNNANGYTRKNCRLVILAVNVALNLWGDEAFLNICRSTVFNADRRR